MKSLAVIISKGEIMNVVTIGGATHDIFLDYNGADYMKIVRQSAATNYLIFESGDKVEIESLFYQSGGGGTNTAAAFKKRGFTTTCCVSVGNDYFGDCILQELKEYNLNCSLIQQNNNLPSGASFIINAHHAERTIFTFRGANSNLNPQLIPFDSLTSCNYLYITSLHNQAAQQLPLIVKKARSLNIPIAINPGKSQLGSGAQIFKKALASIDILIMNKVEAELFMKTLITQDNQIKKNLATKQYERSSPWINKQVPYLLHTSITLENNSFSLKKFFKIILEMGPRIVIITNGENGVYVATQNECYFHPSKKITMVDSVGAGDSFGSYFVASLLQGHSLATALRHGIINSASVLQHLGAKTGLLDQEILNEKEKELDVSLLYPFSLQDD